TALDLADHRLAGLGAAGRLHQLPELFDAKAIEGVAETGPQRIADQVVPTAQVRRRAPALLRDFRQEFPYSAAQARRPLAAGRVESRFQGLGQLLGFHRWFVARIDSLNETGRLLDLSFRPDIHHCGLSIPVGVRAGRTIILDNVADIELQTPAVTSFPGN